MTTEIDLRNAAKVNFFVDAGNSWNTQLTILDSLNVAINLTGSSITFKIKKALTDTTFVQQMAIGSGLTITGTSFNKIAVVPASLVIGDYVYEVVITQLSGEVLRIKGNIYANEQ